MDRPRHAAHRARARAGRLLTKAGRLLAVAAGVLAALSGCGRTKPEAPGARVLTVVGPWEVTGIDPSRTGNLYSHMEIAETLLDADDSGQPRPGLAARWTTSPDGLQWTFTLRPGARFHDGTAVTGAIVAADLRRADSQPGVFDYVSIAAIDAAADTITIHLNSPSALLPAVLAHYSAQILAPASFDARGQVTRIVASGPYRLTDLSNQGFSVVRAASWNGPRPAIERARYLSVGRSETRSLMAESGEADIVFTLDPASIDRLRGNPDVTMLTAPVFRTTILKLNSGHPFLNDVRARQAISLALDRPGIAAALVRDPAMSATQLFPPVMRGWHDPSVPALASDPAKARALLAALGWRRMTDGILARNGQRFVLHLITYFDRPEMPPMATAIQEQLRRIGIEVAVSVDSSSAIPAGHKNGTLELALAARNWATTIDPAGTLLQDYGPSGGDWGAMGWSDPQVTAALRRLAAGVSPAERDPLRAEVAGALQAGLPVIPVMWYRQIETHSRRVANVSIDPLERSYRISRMRWAG